MSTLTSQPPHSAALTQSPSLLTEDRCVIAVSRSALVLSLAMAAVIVRAWRIGVPFESSDQAVMAYLLQHTYGIRWLFAHEYGPVTPIIYRTWFEILSRLHLPINETAFRIPLLIIGLGQVAMTYPLMRRLRCSVREALFGTLCCALLPTLVSDVRMVWAWGYLSIWLLTGSIALWALLAFLDDCRTWRLFVCAGALLMHCLSNTYSFALPATLLAVFAVRWLSRRRATAPLPASDRTALTGVLFTCVAALVTIVLCWHITGRGQICHLLMKHARGTTGIHFDQIPQLPAMWARQFAYVFGVVTAIAMMAGPFLLKQRQGILLIWAWTSLTPVLLLADWDCIGYPEAYFIETCYAGGLLGVLVLSWLRQRLSGRAALRFVTELLAFVAMGHLLIATADQSLFAGSLTRWTGLACRSDVSSDTGIKAAGWYIRHHISADAIIMPLHTNKGMEIPVAEYYAGRRVLAGYDQASHTWPALLRTMHDDIDVVVVEPDQRKLLHDYPEFSCVCTLRHCADPVRYIYARDSLQATVIDEQITVLNDLYDREYVTRHVPAPLPAVDRYCPLLKKYQDITRTLSAEFGVRGSPTLTQDHK